jgi:hypothetical protein
MQRRDLNKNELDAIGQKLVESTRLGSVDVDLIVADPHLFDTLRARIAANTGQGSPTAVRSFTATRRFTAAAAVMAMVLVIYVATLGLLNKENSVSAVVVEQVPEAVPVTARPDDHPPKPMFRKLPSGRAFQSRSQVKAEKPLYKKPVQKADTEPSALPEGEFYALSFAGDLEETAAGGRIIRVDMPRSSLFAMGINIPLENGREMVKTDLLIGSDGMTRAVRIVE